MSDYPEVEALIAGRYHTSPEARFQVMAMKKELEALKKQPTGCYHFTCEETTAMQKELKTQEQELKERMHGIWQLQAEKADLRGEIIALTEQVEALKQKNTNQAINCRSQLEFYVIRDKLLSEDAKIIGRLQEEIKQLKQQLKAEQKFILDEADELRINLTMRINEVKQLKADNTEFQKEIKQLKRQLDGCYLPVTITDEMVMEAQKKIKVLKEQLNNQASTIAQDARTIERLQKENKQTYKQLKEAQETVMCLRSRLNITFVMEDNLRERLNRAEAKVKELQKENELLKKPHRDFGW